MANHFARTSCAVLAAVCLAGCGRDDDPGGSARRPALLPPLATAARIVVEAEDAIAVEPDMAIEESPPATHPVLGLQAASRGRCVAVPKDANKDRKENPRGKVTMKFSVPRDGAYYIYPRTWWNDGCSNSLGMILDGSSPLVVTDATYEVWHWVKLLPDEPGASAPRAFKLAKGEHIITFTNREDNVKLDQVYVTDAPGASPAGIMEPSQ